MKASEIFLEFARPVREGLPEDITVDQLNKILMVPELVWNAVVLEKGLALLMFVYLQVTQASVFDQYKFMDVKAAQAKWGQEKLDKNKFKNSGYNGDSIKAKMAAHIVGKQIYKGSEIALVYKELGTTNGYFISDLSPAYVLQRPTEEKSEGWQLVFIPTEDSKKVKEVRILKTCCER